MEGIPTPSDFFDAGKGLLDFAWDVIADLLAEYGNAELSGLEPEEFSADYWKAAARHLATAASVTQQGIEFVLKGRICEVSPFLLLADQPNKWPSPYGSESVAFGDLRTIDAQDLVKVHDTFCQNTLPSDFVLKFSQMRRERNRIMHTVEKDLVIQVSDVVDTLLFMHKSLFPSESWPAIRLKFIEEKYSILWIGEYAINAAAEEIALIYKLLTPAKLIAYFNVNKRQRLYTCPGCLSKANRDWDFEHKLAVLQPNTPKSTTVYCPICDQLKVVVRESCEVGKCRGNVIDEEGRCLTCAT